MDEKDVKLQENASQFDITKICRTCLTDKGEMRSVFQTDDSIGQTKLSEMIMGFTNVQISTEDGLPPLICMQCILQVSRAFSFKQLCEQSDSSLRQYLGKPLLTNKQDKEAKEFSQNSEFLTSALLLENFDLNNSSNESDEDSFNEDFFPILETSSVLTPAKEKLMAQKQLLAATKLSKGKLSKKKLLAKLSVRPGVIKQLKRSGYQCSICKKQLISLKSFRKHLRTHIGDGPYKCKLCPRGFTEENYLNNHMRTHMPDDQKPHECKVCKKRFIHATLLNKHMLKHSGEKPFVCKICNKGCYAENSLLKHMKIHEKKEGDPGLLKHICDYCRSEFPDAQTLDAHIKQHTGDRPFLCTMCGKCFPQRFNLDLHLRTHTGERPFTCEICKNGYVSKASLKIHLRTHTNERPFVCDFCGKAFKQSGDLTSHKRLHGTEKPIECSVCQKRFTTVMKLKYHMRNHTGERPYVCSVCGRGFTVNTILLRHMRVHSGERPYVCVTCGKAFSQSSTLNTHMKVHASSPKYNPQESNKPHLPPYEPPANDQKFSSIIDHQNVVTSRLLQPTDNRMMQQDVQQRMLQQQQDNRMLSANEAAKILTDTVHLLTDNRTGTLIDEHAAEHMLSHVNGTDQPRLLVNDTTRLLTATDARLLANVHDNTRLLTSVADNRLLANDNSRHLAVIENSRLLADKYLTSYDPYHRGHL